MVAIDAAPGFGTLAGRIDEAPPGDYSAVLNDTDVQGYADIREHLGQNAVGLDVLAGNRASDQPRPLVPSMFTGVLSRLRRTHNVIVVDTADDLEHPVMKAVFDACDTLVFVSGLTADTSLPVPGRSTCCGRMGYHELVSRSMVVLNDSRDNYDEDALRVSHRTVRAIRRHRRIHAIRSASRQGRHNRYPARIEEKTRLRLFEITAALADKYIPDADRPRLNGEGFVSGPLRGCGGMRRTPGLAGISGIGAGRGVHRRHRRVAQRRIQAPRPDRAESGVGYELHKANGVRLDVTKTLDELGVEDGATLVLVPAVERRIVRAAVRVVVDRTGPRRQADCSNRSRPKPPPTPRWPSWRWSRLTVLGLAVRNASHSDRWCPAW